MSTYCRNCSGETLRDLILPCLNCGVKPLNGNSYCNGCGVGTSEKQEICINPVCGVAFLENPYAWYNSSTDKWYNSNVSIIVWTIIFFPVAIYGLLKRFDTRPVWGDLDQTRVGAKPTAKLSRVSTYWNSASPGDAQDSLDSQFLAGDTNFGAKPKSKSNSGKTAKSLHWTARAGKY